MTTNSPMKRSFSPDEDDLIFQAKSGDAAAVAELYDQNHEGVFRFLWSRTRDRQLAEDLTSEVFVRMVSALQDYDQRGFAIRVWLFRIARNLLTDHFRKQAGQPEAGSDAEESTFMEPDLVEDQVDMKISKENLLSAIEKISQTHQEVVVLRFINGLSIKDTAKILDKSVSSVKALQHRGLLALRAVLSEE